MKNKIVLIVLTAMSLLTIAGCAIILGEEAPPEGEGALLKFSFVEMLRNQESLRGERFREIADSADPATALQRPNSVFADAFRVYVTDTTPARVFIFDRGERTASALSVPLPPAEGKLISPAGIAVDSTGVIFVSDAQQGRVFGYDRNGQLLVVIGRIVNLSLPSGLAIDSRRSRLYVADSHAQQVKVFSTIGNHLFDIGGSGNASEDFKFPVAVALDGGGNLYVLDSQRKRVHVYDPDGKFVRAFRTSGNVPEGPVRPKGIAVDSNGHVYVSDAVNNNVLIFDGEGKFIQGWGRTGKLAGDFLMPAGIFIDSQDTIYIADQANGRVQVFRYFK